LLIHKNNVPIIDINGGVALLLSFYVVCMGLPVVIIILPNNYGQKIEFLGIIVERKKY